MAELKLLSDSDLFLEVPVVVEDQRLSTCIEKAIRERLGQRNLYKFRRGNILSLISKLREDGCSTLVFPANRKVVMEVMILSINEITNEVKVGFFLPISGEAKQVKTCVRAMIEKFKMRGILGMNGFQAHVFLQTRVFLPGDIRVREVKRPGNWRQKVYCLQK